MMHKYHRLFSITALMTMLLFTSCLFDSRDANAPDINTGGGCILDSPESAFNCMTKAIAIQNDADYERSLSDQFVFYPTTADSLDQAFAGKPVYQGWTKDVETEVLRKLLDDTSYTKVDFGTPSRIRNENTFVEWNVSYSLRTVNNATPTDTVTYKAVAHIDVRLENGNWRVTLWDEVETVANFSTWGFLRGIIRLPLLP